MRFLSGMPVVNSFVHEMNRLQRDLETAFTSPEAANFPALNIWEDEDHLYVESELAGFQQNDLEAFIVGHDQLVLKGESKPLNYEKAVCHRQERSFGKFERTVKLPFPVDGDKVEAKFTNGVLQLKLAKSPIAKPKKIAIAIS